MAKATAADTITQSGPKTPPRKPLIFADSPIDGMDDEMDSLGRYDDPLASHPSYIHGYSNVKRENALRARDGLDQIPLPRAQWVRISKGGGENVSSTDEAMHNWRKLGYRAVGLDDLEALGWDMPATAHVAADGTIRRGDLALFMVSEARAQHNREVEARVKTEAKAAELAPQHEGLSLTQNTKAVEHSTNPRTVLEAGLPKL